MARSTVRFALIVVLCACSSPTEPFSRQVTLTTMMSWYAPGATLSAALVNRSGSEIGYGDCSLTLERLDGTQWEGAGPEPRPCLSLLNVVAPGRATMMQFVLDRTLVQGIYRLRQEIMPGTSLPYALIRSTKFEVGWPP